MIGDEYCPKCDGTLKTVPKYDKETDTMRYRCSNLRCDYVLVTETLANKKKTMLRLAPIDTLRLRRGL